jgi:hypothetical protein
MRILKTPERDKISEVGRCLRDLVDSAQARLWIASPYVGSWKAVSCILGDRWQKVELKVLIDKDGGNLAEDSIRKLAAHGPIRSLTGLHAKLYIVDDSVLVTSANLSECAFTKRYESGLLLTGEEALQMIVFYEDLWHRAQEACVDEIQFSRPSKGLDEGYPGQLLPRLFALPSPPERRPRVAKEFRDYPSFLKTYDRFAEDYGEPDAVDQPFYFETDKFLVFLFDEAAGQPSKEYKSKTSCRNLTDRERRGEIEKYREGYRDSQHFRAVSDHSEKAKIVQEYLAEPKVTKLTKYQVEEIAKNLNCFATNHLALFRFVNKIDRDLEAIRKHWSDLVHGKENVEIRMDNCHSALFGFGRAAIQETLGYFDPKRFPLRNETTNAGLRFLGYRIDP